DETAGGLAERLAAIGSELMVVALERLKAGALQESPQEHDKATLAPLLRKEDGRIDWARPAEEVRNRIRGLDPWPGTFTQLGSEVVKVWGAKSAEGVGFGGQVLGLDPEGLVVACGEGAVSLAELQLPGRKRMSAHALVAG